MSGDPRVLEAQQWLNSRYGNNPNFSGVDEDGYINSFVFIALTEALQIELNSIIPEGEEALPVTGYFGDQTKSVCPTLSLGDDSIFVTILQHGLFCKGYNVWEVSEVFDTNTVNAITELQEDAGLLPEQISSSCTPMIFQAVLSTEYYVRVPNGLEKVREMQRNLNRQYMAYTGLQPCDGIYSRATNEALIYALQAEERLPIGVANGWFGEATTSCCPTMTFYENGYTMFSGNGYTGGEYTSQEIENFVTIVKYYLYCNGITGYSAVSPPENRFDPGEFTGTPNAQTLTALHAFQESVALPVNDTVNIDVWMALAVSTGNPNRAATAIDCSVRLTQAKIDVLINQHYTTVGRYLTGNLLSSDATTRIPKQLLRSEMKLITKESNGLHLFLIYQDDRQYYIDHPAEEDISNYFSSEQGAIDADIAFNVAKNLGVPDGEIIYFAVDYDFMEPQVISDVIPYFAAIHQYKQANNVTYQIGIYSARHTCSLVAEAGYSVSSFVGDLSRGYSGNMGYPLPEDWAFDQIQETEQYASDGSFGIDRDVMSGRYIGFNTLSENTTEEFENMNGDIRINFVRDGLTNARMNIPVYQVKTKVNGQYVAKYPLSYIAQDAFYNILPFKTNRSDSANDHIRYVYFLDHWGFFNGGYIDESTFAPGSYGTGAEHSFLTYGVYRDSDTNEASLVTHQPVGGMYPYLVTRTLSCLNAGGENMPNIVEGTILGIPIDPTRTVASAGISYPYTICAQTQMVPGSNTWTYIDTESYGFVFVDLDYENGVLPYNRSLE